VTDCGFPQKKFIIDEMVLLTKLEGQKNGKRLYLLVEGSVWLSSQASLHVCKKESRVMEELIIVMFLVLLILLEITRNKKK